MIKDLVKDTRKIKIVYLNYTQYSSRYDDFRSGKILPAFDIKRGGGALRDINIYNIHFVVSLFGYPRSILYIPNIENNVDVSGTLILRYDEFSCTLIGAKDCLNNAEIRIQGDKTTIISHSPANVIRNFELITDKQKETYDVQSNDNRLFYELCQFNRIIKENDYGDFEKYRNETLAVLKVVDQALSAIDINT